MIWKLFPGGVMFFIGTTCKFLVFSAYIGGALFLSMEAPGDRGAEAVSNGILLIAYVVWYRRDLALARLKAKTNRTTRASA